MKITKDVLFTGAPPAVPGTIRMSPDRRLFAYWGRGNNGFICITNHHMMRNISTPQGVVADTIAFSADSKRLAVGTAHRGEQAFVLDGVKLRSHRKIGNGSFVFSPNSKRFAYTAESQAGQKHLVIDGEDGPSFDAILGGSPVFSTNSTRVAVTGRRGAEIFVAIDDILRGPFDATAEGTPLFCDRSGSDIIVARKGQRWAILINGIEQVSGDIVGHAFKAGRMAWIQRVEENKYHVFVDAVKRMECDDIYPPIVFNKDGWRVGFKYRQGTSWFVAIDDHDHGPYLSVADYRLIFSDTNDGWATIIGKRGYQKLLMNGILASAFESTDSETFTFDSSGINLYYARQSLLGWQMIRRGHGAMSKGTVYISVSEPVL